MPEQIRITRWRRRRRNDQQKTGRLIFKLLAGFIIFLLLTGAGLGIAVFTGATAVYAAVTDELPSFSEITRLNRDGTAVTILYAWQDREEINPVPIYKIQDPLAGERKWHSLEEFPPFVQDVIIAGLDPDFRQTENINFVDIAINLWHAGRGQSTQPIAPLAQQVVRDSLLADEIGFRRTLDELLLTRRLYNTFSQEQILEWFLNTAYFGRLAFGVEAAARVYFDKPLSSLTLAEAAVLAPLPFNPEQNPIDDLEAAVANQITVLEIMADAGTITRDQLAAAQFTPLVVSPAIQEQAGVIAPQFALYVQEALIERLGPEQVISGNLRVFTTLNLAMQQQAECVARVHVGRLSGQIGPVLPADEQARCDALAYLPEQSDEYLGIDRQVDNAALVVLEAETSAIKVMVGSLSDGRSQSGGLVNQAVNNFHQPGTILAPVTALTALSQGYTAATMVLDVETDFGAVTGSDSFIPQNEDGRFHGPMRLRQSLGSEFIVPAVQVMGWVGPNRVARTAQSLGLNTLLADGSPLKLSFALGGGEITLMDLAFAYNVVNNMGMMLGQLPPGQTEEQLEPAAIWRIEDENGELLFENTQSDRREIVTPQLAYLLNDMLSDRIARCDGLGCPNLLELPDNRLVAAAAGSTNDFRDAWTVGYTPQLLTAVWVGNHDNQPMSEVTGLDGAAPIWHAFMAWAMQGEPVAIWTRPPGLVERNVCEISGLLATPACPTVSELFVEGTEPVHQDTMVQEIAVNRETGRLATMATPPELVEYRTFTIYPAAAAAWAEANGIEAPPSDFDSIPSGSLSKGIAAVTSPSPFSTIQGVVPITGTAAGLNFANYRLSYFAGLTPSNLQVITHTVAISRENELLGEWDVSNLDGLVSLLLTVVDANGRFQEVTVPLTVDNNPPTLAVRTPMMNEAFPAETETVTMRVLAQDNLGVAQVAYYLDEGRQPIAVLAAPPFSFAWQVEDPGCHILTAVARDLAGNQTSSTAVPFCILEP